MHIPPLFFRSFAAASGKRLADRGVASTEEELKFTQPFTTSSATAREDTWRRDTIDVECSVKQRKLQHHSSAQEVAVSVDTQQTSSRARKRSFDKTISRSASSTAEELPSKQRKFQQNSDPTACCIGRCASDFKHGCARLVRGCRGIPALVEGL